MLFKNTTINVDLKCDKCDHEFVHIATIDGQSKMVTCPECDEDVTIVNTIDAHKELQRLNIEIQKTFKLPKTITMKF